MAIIWVPDMANQLCSGSIFSTRQHKMNCDHVEALMWDWSIQVAIGLVVALDYKNPYMNPYEEYQVLSFLQP
jgi:hypothetical protein